MLEIRIESLTYEFNEEIQKFLMRDWKNSSGNEVACAEVICRKGGELCGRK